MSGPNHFGQELVKLFSGFLFSVISEKLLSGPKIIKIKTISCG
jgi:hypothetical protein